MTTRWDFKDAGPDGDSPIRRVAEYRLDADGLGSLAPFEASSLLAEGRLTLIGLDAVIERCGPRWPTRRGQVYDYVERTLRQRLDPDASVIRVSARDYLVAQPRLSRLAGQAQCFDCLREALAHFLGEVREADLKVYQVATLLRRRIEAARVDPRMVEAAAAEERSWSAAGGETAPSPLFVAGDGRRIMVSCGVEPLYHLKTNALIGHRLDRRVRVAATDEPIPDAQLQRLPRGDIERIDLALIARGLSRLASEPNPAARPGLVIPISFINLSHPRGRELISAAFEAAQRRAGKAVICEIVDLDGATAAALAEATLLIKPFCLLTIGRLESRSPSLVRAFRQAGLQGVSHVCPPSIQGDAEFIGWARTAIASARRAGRAVLLYGLANLRRAAIAQVLGATHASLRLAAP
jgi:hypothetical protein